MLALLKPWGSLSDLKADGESFEQVFTPFVAGTSQKNLDIIENIQYYYECYDGAKKRQDMEATASDPVREVEFEDERAHDDLGIDSMVFRPEVADITDEDIEMTYATRGAMRERLHAQVALNAALEHGVFPETIPDTVFLPRVEKARVEDLKTFQGWEEQLKAVCRREAEEGGPALLISSEASVPAVVAHDAPPGGQDEPVGNNDRTPPGDRPKRDLLNGDQRRAHDIIEAQLLKRMAGLSLLFSPNRKN
jgi:hypothetical protein